jgi:hypothetical protein
MTTVLHGLNALSDQALLSEVQTAAQRERADTARVIALLTEVDKRRLYLNQGCASLFTFCTQVLHLSEHAAYGRIEAARAARRFPIILNRLAEGAITLTTVSLIAPHLTVANHQTASPASDGCRHAPVSQSPFQLLLPPSWCRSLTLRHPPIRMSLHSDRSRQYRRRPLGRWSPR